MAEASKKLSVYKLFQAILMVKDGKTQTNSDDTEPGAGDSLFEQQAGKKPPGILLEFLDFLRQNKRWWLTPIIVILLILSFLIALTNTAIGPALYLLF